MQEEITIEKAEKFLSDGETRSAGNLAGVLFEQSVQKLCALHQISLSNDLSTRDLLDRLRDANVISWEKNRELQNLVSIRNKCAHATPVTKDEVQTLIQGTKKFMRWVDSHSSTASARPSSTQPHLDAEYTGYVVRCAQCGVETQVPFLPRNNRPVYCQFCASSMPSKVDSQSSIVPPRPLAPQPPTIRTQLVCPVCGKDNRVRKVSGITRNRLLQFPAFPSRSKRERMTSREHFYYISGWLLVILGVVLLCPLSFTPLKDASTWVGLLVVLGIFVSGLFMIIVPRRKAAERLQGDRLRASEIWDTLYYCDRDDALYSSERPEYYVSAENLRKMLGY